MMLDSISKVIQSFSVLLNVDIAYFNSNGKIIAATEEYIKQKGESAYIPFFQRLHRHNVTFLHQPGEMNMCQGCHFLNNCPSKFEIIQDMIINGKKYGYLSFVSFSSEHEKVIIKEKEKYIYWLTKLKEIIISILIDHGVISAYDYIHSNNPKYVFGKNKKMEHIETLINNIKYSISSILITGETGTGKSLLARYIHSQSTVGKGPFIEINCATIPESLFESELFGYDEGAFTGASKKGKPGYFELADQGTLFLDEIADLPIHLQPKLLKVLQDGIIQRVGGTTSKRVDVRIIAATNQSFEYLISEKRFRDDLFYRLNVIPITIPPLKERKEDFHLFLKMIIKKMQERTGKMIKEFSDDFLANLMDYDWPGNLRELENVIEYSMNMETTNKLTKASLPPYILEKVSLPSSEKKETSPLVNAEREAITKQLDKQSGQ